MVHDYNMEYEQLKKRCKIVSSSEMWVDLERGKHSEVSQREKQILYINACYVESVK